MKGIKQVCALDYMLIMGGKSVMDSKGGVEVEAKCHSHDLVKEVV